MILLAVIVTIHYKFIQNLTRNLSSGGFAPMALRAMTGWSLHIIFYNLFYFGYELQNHFGIFGEHWNYNIYTS